MLREFRLQAALIAVAFMSAACGGGGGGTGQTVNAGGGGGTVTTTTASTQSTTTQSGQTTTTLSGQTTTSLAGQTTTTSSSTTTTGSSTTTTIDANLPPVSRTPIKLAKYPQQQTLGTANPDWSESYWDKGPTANAGNAFCGDYNRGFREFPHVHLSIFRNGERLMIPKEIGYRTYCIFNTNTDILNGVVDAFPEVNMTGYLTLGDFFYVWGMPLTANNVAGITGLPMAIFIEDNGRLSRYTGDPTKIEMLPFRSITIQLGTPLAEIPTYDWSDYGGPGE